VETLDGDTVAIREGLTAKGEIVLVNRWRAETVASCDGFPSAAVGLKVSTASGNITSIFATSRSPPKQHFNGLVAGSLITEHIDEGRDAPAGKGSEKGKRTERLWNKVSFYRIRVYSGANTAPGVD
jgi:hypothetical protein